MRIIVNMEDSNLEGPILTRGPNIHPAVFERLVSCAEKNNIPVQIEADPRPTGTDARSIQVAREGVPTGLVGIPLRYMHTPSEVIDLEDLEAVVQLLVAFAVLQRKQQNSFNFFK